MLTASAQFATAIGSLTQTVAAQFTITLPTIGNLDLTAALHAVSLDTQNNTDLPDGVRDIEGASTIGGTVTLGAAMITGVGLSAVDLFNPDNPGSPLYRSQVQGAPVTVSVGVGEPGSTAPEYVRKLTGVVTTIDVDFVDGTVALGVADTTYQWKALPAIEPVTLPAPYNAGLTSEFAMDALLRAATSGLVSTWFPPHPLTLLSAGFRTSICPEVGQLTTIYGEPVPAFANYGGPGSVLANVDSSASTLQGLLYALPSQVLTDTLFYEFKVCNLQPGTGVGQVTSSAGVTLGKTNIVAGPPTRVYFNGLGVQATATGVTVSVMGSTVCTVAATLTGTAEHYIALQASFNESTTTWSGTVTVDSTTQTFSYAANSGASPKTWQFGNVVVVNAGMSSLVVTTETTPALDSAWTPTATMDPSLNPLTVIPAITAGTTVTDELQTICAAEAGYGRMCEDGVWRFNNRQTLAASTLARTVTETGSLKNMQTSLGAAVCYDQIQVPYTGWAFGAPTAVWTASTVRHVPRKSAITWTITLATNALAAMVPIIVGVLANGASPTDGNSWYRASADPNGVTAHPGLTITVATPNAGTLLITAANTTGADAWLCTPASYTDLTAGTPSLWIGGIPVTADDEASVQVTTGAGTSLLQLGSNGYLQDPFTATMLGNWLLNQLGVPIRDFTNIDIVPDPRLQAADLIELLAPSRAKLTEYARIWAWSFSATFPSAGESNGTWDMTLSARALGAPGAWLLGIPGRSELGDGSTANPGTAYLYGVA